MSAPVPLESQLLAHAERFVENFSQTVSEGKRFEARLQLLEAASSRLGGFPLNEYFAAFGIRALVDSVCLDAAACKLLSIISQTPIHSSFALSSLSREPIPEADRKSTGAYYTDFRLAQRIAELSGVSFSARAKVIDPACGAGILLVALSIKACGANRRRAADWLRTSVCASDRSARSLRGARLALASLTDDLDAIVAMDKRFIQQDSLLASEDTWSKIAPSGFDVVVANPPWEKVKLTQHEYLRANGTARHYGSRIEGLDSNGYRSERQKSAAYARELASRYRALATGEPDLYIAFTELFLRIVKPGGVVSALVPAGLIRSQGTAALRQAIFDESHSLSISILDNRARFFAIDTRFKFLAISLAHTGGGGHSKSIEIKHECGTETGVETVGVARLDRNVLAAIRPDLTIPEVRSDEEWRVFSEMCRHGETFGESCDWEPEFAREVDMTNDKKHFAPIQRKGALPVVEGRMVQQHRFGAKGYVCGSGRSAVWDSYRPGKSQIRPQHFISGEVLSSRALERAAKLRAGFCDIAGQTNERAMMAALIPPGVVCGNKVPTVLFKNDPSDDRLFVWTAVVNSVPFDWMLRRILTTTVNYFLLLSLPMPRLVKNGLPWKHIVQKAKELLVLDTHASSTADLWKIAELRADIDVLVSIAYGLTWDGLAMLFNDFPLLDRTQPALPGEARSTVTRDYALSRAAKKMKRDASVWLKRVAEAKALGAVPYVYSETAARIEKQQSERDIYAR